MINKVKDRIFSRPRVSWKMTISVMLMTASVAHSIVIDEIDVLPAMVMMLAGAVLYDFTFAHKELCEKHLLLSTTQRSLWRMVRLNNRWAKRAHAMEINISQRTQAFDHAVEANRYLAAVIINSTPEQLDAMKPKLISFLEAEKELS